MASFVGSILPLVVCLLFVETFRLGILQLPNDTIIQVWQGGMEEVERAISLGMNVIYSSCWYLDLIEYGTKWSKYYQCDPADTTYGNCYRTVFCFVFCQYFYICQVCHYIEKVYAPKNGQ